MTEKRAPTVLITGATGAMGTAIARVYADNGWNLMLWYRANVRQAGALEEMAEKAGVRCECRAVDFADAEEVQDAVRALKGCRIDALVNNAGGYAVQKRFSDLSHGEVAEALAVNFTSAFLLASTVFEQMASRGRGWIVNISSVAAKYGGSALSMQYGCAKRALEGITRTLAREGAACGVLVNTVRPGVIDTGFHERMNRDMTARIALIPMKRMGTPQEVANVVFGLGSRANSFVTGQCLAVSGGE